MFRKERGFCKVLNRIIQRFCKVFDKGTAAGRTCLVQHDVVDSMVPDADALHILAADVKDAVDVVVEKLCSIVMRDGFNLAFIQHERGLDQRFAVTGRTGPDDPHTLRQLAVDVYETADKLVVKARTAGISKSDLDVSISDNILTISGVLSGGEDEQTTRWHIQECYWGEFSRTIALPVQVREDENSVKAELKDGVLTITFEKEKTEAPKKITIS